MILTSRFTLVFLWLSIGSCQAVKPEGSEGSEALAVDVATSIDEATRQAAADPQNNLNQTMAEAGFKLHAIGYIMAQNSVNPNAVRDCIAPPSSKGGPLTVKMVDRFAGLKSRCLMFALFSQPANDNVARFAVDVDGGLCVTDGGYKNPLGLATCPNAPDDPEARFTFNWDNQSKFKAIMSERPQNPLCWDRGEVDGIMRLWNCKWSAARGDNQSWLFHGVVWKNDKWEELKQ